MKFFALLRFTSNETIATTIGVHRIIRFRKG